MIYSFRNQGVLTMAPFSISRKAAAIGLAFAATALISVPATAQEGGIIRSIFGAIGIAGPERPAIEYRERAPLVVPPSRELPPPVAPDALAANPQWPDDPTLRSRDGVRGLGLSNDASGPMTIEEIRAGRRAGVGGNGTNFIAMDDDVAARALSREELAINPFDDNEDSRRLTRRYLTDPPNALLQQVPTN